MLPVKLFDEDCLILALKAVNAYLKLDWPITHVRRQAPLFFRDSIWGSSGWGIAMVDVKSGQLLTSMPPGFRAMNVCMTLWV